MFTNADTQKIQKELETCYFLSEENEKLLPEKVLQQIAHFSRKVMLYMATRFPS